MQLFVISQRQTKKEKMKHEIIELYNVQLIGMAKKMPSCVA